MNRLKRWIVERYLPAYAKQALIEENTRLLRELAECKQELETSHAYSRGLEVGLRSFRRITINTEVK